MTTIMIMTTAMITITTTKPAWPAAQHGESPAEASA